MYYEFNSTLIIMSNNHKIKFDPGGVRYICLLYLDPCVGFDIVSLQYLR